MTDLQRVALALYIEDQRAREYDKLGMTSKECDIYDDNGGRDDGLQAVEDYREEKAREAREAEEAKRRQDDDDDGGWFASPDVSSGFSQSGGGTFSTLAEFESLVSGGDCDSWIYFDL